MKKLSQKIYDIIQKTKVKSPEIFKEKITYYKNNRMKLVKNDDELYNFCHIKNEYDIIYFSTYYYKLLLFNYVKTMHEQTDFYSIIQQIKFLMYWIILKIKLNKINKINKKVYKIVLNNNF